MRKRWRERGKRERKERGKREEKERKENWKRDRERKERGREREREREREGEREKERNESKTSKLSLVVLDKNSTNKVWPKVNCLISRDLWNANLKTAKIFPNNACYWINYHIQHTLYFILYEVQSIWLLDTLKYL